MFQMLKNKLKEQKGFTLIELLAVIVILGILAAIAIPSIIGVINNSKKDAHVATAEQIVSSAKIYIADKKINVTTDTPPITLKQLIDDGYLDSIKDPNNKGYDTTATAVYVTKIAATKDTPEKTEYKINLVSDSKSGVTYYLGGKAADEAIDATNLSRSDVTLP